MSCRRSHRMVEAAPDPPLMPQSRSKSRWCVLIGRQSWGWPWTPKTSPWPRLTHGGAFRSVRGCSQRIHKFAACTGCTLLVEELFRQAK
jgi:hypothetical protein